MLLELRIAVRIMLLELRIAVRIMLHRIKTNEFLNMNK